MEQKTTQIIIVGAGPCGVTIANYLGTYGIATVLIDRAPDILDYPRAVGIDDEALRGYQAVGLTDALLGDMIQNVPLRYFDSQGRPITQVRPQAQPFGWPRRNGFLQPLMEATLRRGLERFAGVETLYGHELVGLSQDDGGVVAEIRAAEDQPAFTIRADYVVGADGGRSTVRKLIGVELEGRTSQSKWLVADVEQSAVYAPFAGTYLHSVRPHMSIDLPYGHRRFEFRVLPNETDEEMLKPETLDRLLRTHFPNYGPLPRLKRSRIYLHHSRVAERFQVGRVFLAGDAAHLQPPWFGQGMNSGLRDAVNLGWKLAAVLTGRAHPKILESYNAERRGHARAMVNLATFLGVLYSPKNRWTETLRRLIFRVIQISPGIRDYILQMRFKPLPRYREGIVLHPGTIEKNSPVGRMFMQPTIETRDHRKLKLDDAIGNWFAVIGVNRDPAAALGETERAFWRGIGASFVRINKSRSDPASWNAAPGTLVFDDTEGAFRDWSLERPAAEIIVLRPDRYVAALSTAADFASVTRAFQGLMT